MLYLDLLGLGVGGGGEPCTHLFGLLVVERVKRGGRLHAVGCNVFLHYNEQGLNIYIYKNIKVLRQLQCSVS